MGIDGLKPPVNETRVVLSYHRNGTGVAFFGKNAVLFNGFQIR